MKQILMSLLFIVATGANAQTTAPRSSDALRRDMAIARSRVYPALVNISVVMRYFSGGRALRTSGGGSGVIVTKQGHVLTNYHVAGRTTRIRCTLTNGETLDATVVTDDPLTDISVLKLNLDKRQSKTPIPYAKLGDSDALQVGDYVMAMGNPMMLASSVTLGIVSNPKRVFTDRTGTEIERQELSAGETTGTLTRWIQHDALILPGNSGGPLVNLKGEVVGINELGGSGVGFAIPSRIAADILHQALTCGKVTRGWIGISVLPVGKLGRKSGALVSTVIPDSPAAKAGVEPGDFLLSVNSDPVTLRFVEETPLVYQKVAALKSGVKAKLVVERLGKKETLTVTPTVMEPSIGDEEEFRDAGISAQDITGPMALQRELPDTKGVLVTGLRPGYPLDSAQPRIQEGDVILTIDSVPVNDLTALRKALKPVTTRNLTISLRRRHESLVTVAKPPVDKPQEESTELPKPWLGVRTQVMTPEVAGAVKLPNVKGFRITDVYPWTEANAAGLRAGDVITALNGSNLDSSRQQDSEDLKRAIEDMSIGDTVELTLYRDGAPMKVGVKMEVRPSSSEHAKTSRQKDLEFTVRDVTMMDRMENRWTKNQTGVLVSEVTAGGWAQVSGLNTDDLILSINGGKVDGIDSFDKVMGDIMKHKPRTITVFIRRNEQTDFVFIEPDWSKLAVGK